MQNRQKHLDINTGGNIYQNNYPKCIDISEKDDSSRKRTLFDVNSKDLHVIFEDKTGDTKSFLTNFPEPDYTIDRKVTKRYGNLEYQEITVTHEEFKPRTFIIVKNIRDKLEEKAVDAEKEVDKMIDLQEMLFTDYIGPAENVNNPYKYIIVGNPGVETDEPGRIDTRNEAFKVVYNGVKNQTSDGDFWENILNIETSTVSQAPRHNNNFKENLISVGKYEFLKKIGGLEKSIADSYKRRKMVIYVSFDFEDDVPILRQNRFYLAKQSEPINLDGSGAYFKINTFASELGNDEIKIIHVENFDNLTRKKKIKAIFDLQYKLEEMRFLQEGENADLVFKLDKPFLTTNTSNTTTDSFRVDDLLKATFEIVRSVKSNQSPKKGTLADMILKHEINPSAPKANSNSFPGNKREEFALVADFARSEATTLKNKVCTLRGIDRSQIQDMQYDGSGSRLKHFELNEPEEKSFAQKLKGLFGCLLPGL